jgi:hypothetical protein
LEKLDSQAALNRVKRDIDFGLKRAERLEKESVGCIIKSQHAALIQDLTKKELEHNGYESGNEEFREKLGDVIHAGNKETSIYKIKSAQDLIDKAYERAAEAKALYPIAEARIHAEAEKRNKAIQKAERNMEIDQAKLEKEQQQISALEESIRKEKELQEKVRLEEEKRKRLEAEKAAIESRAHANNSVTTPSYSHANSPNVNSSKFGDGYLKKDGLFCLSKTQFHRQIDLLARGQTNLAPGCYIVPNKQNVWLVNSRWNGEYIVERISDGRKLYILGEDYQDH